MTGFRLTAEPVFRLGRGVVSASRAASTAPRGLSGEIFLPFAWRACYLRCEGGDVDFRLLGPLEVCDGARSVAVGGGKRRSLLALLLQHRNEVVSVDRLIDELWGERPPPTAAKGLQVYVSQLRKELQEGGAANGDVLVTRSNGYVQKVGTDEL